MLMIDKVIVSLMRREVFTHFKLPPILSYNFNLKKYSSFLKSKLNQKPPFPPTLLPNF